MSQTYSTADLIKILAGERQACMNGKRLNLAVSPSGSPFLDKFLQPEGLQRFTAYRNFRAAVHDYQRQHGISGIVWQTLTIKGQDLHFPKVDEQLIALPEDLELLKTVKTQLFEFWYQSTADMDLYLSLNGGKSYQLVVQKDVDRIMHRTEWASLIQQGNLSQLEIILQLGWGNPESAAYRHGFPESGSEYVHAVNPGNQPFI
ncbi:hypothetical protein JOY44_07385 [Phormidium sp. CLA17]|uniref:hypothetical protein n=1 Tax=Leptolyngbya sp. Cla-17 TaxID=2803751 RepID=UPI00149297B0|nr:hypothetical protein [Leptolyngbya sp. Cla-17]MBM0741441.1 hypothetical protein [Leptolyngbya sp. Cla-17]